MSARIHLRCVYHVGFNGNPPIVIRGPDAMEVEFFTNGGLSRYDVKSTMGCVTEMRVL